MGTIWREIASALVMGLILPHLMFCFGEEKPRQTQPSIQETKPSQVVEQIKLPVLVASDRVQLMGLEDYIIGVVLAEMPASFEMEALKAQAVVARTYAMRRVALGDRHKDMAICTDSTCCQAYITEDTYLMERGNQADVAKIKAAVEATAGEVLTYNGELIEATYFSCSGGRTEDAVAVWGTEIPYLQAVDSPGEERSDIYENQVYFTAAEFSRKLGRTLTGTPESWLGQKTYTEGGGVASMVIGGITYSGVELRKCLGLNSTAFDMTPDGGGITVKTRGRGHRVGMSQYGADAMAVTGSGYQQILAYYYQGTRIDKLTDLE